MEKLIVAWLVYTMVIQIMVLVIEIVDMYSNKQIKSKVIPILIATGVPLIIVGLIYMYQLSYKLISKML